MTCTRITGLTTALLLATSPMANAQATTATTTPTASANAVSQDYLDQSEVEDRLEERGFSDIDIELADNRYAGSATWYGEDVDLSVNAATGRVEEPSQLNQDQIVNKLEGDGYENVSDVREAGSEYTATAERFGEDVELRVSAMTGNVLDPRELKVGQIKQMLEDEEDYSDVVIFERPDDYGNVPAVADKDDTTYLLDVNPISGDIVEERDAS